ncbi:MAG: carbohydrate ABC transporter permease [Lachnospirales bacterium]
MRKKKIGVGKIIIYVILTLGAITMLLPFIWLMLSTFKSNGEINAFPPSFLPKEWILTNYTELVDRFNIDRYFLNSMYLATVKTAIALYTSLLCGFVLAKYNFKLKKAVYGLILFTMMVPSLVMMIPTYNLINIMGLYNSYTAIIIVSLYSSFGIFMMKQFMTDGIPNELLEAARIDGASEIRIFHTIAVPLSINMISALVIFLFLWNWEDFLWPYLVLQDTDKFPISVALNMFSGQNTTNYGGLFAATAVTIVPIMIVYFIFQKRFVEGVAMSGIK